MAETATTRSGVLSQFPDNTNGDISPRDLRDFVVSTMGGAACMSFTQQNAIQTLTSTPSQVNWFTDFTVDYGDILTLSASPDQMVVQSGGDGYYEFDWRIDAEGLVASATYTFALRVNGLEYTRAICEMRVGDNTILAHTGFKAIRSLNDSDIITLWATADNGSPQNITPVNGFLFARRIG